MSKAIAKAIAFGPVYTDCAPLITASRSLTDRKNFTHWKHRKNK